MTPKFVNLYMRIAETVAETSSAIRSKVGAVAVKDHRILSIGYNGTLPGASNECEYREYLAGSNWVSFDVAKGIWDDPDTQAHYRLVTKPEVMHAEANCLLKMARDGEAAAGADIFLTLSPCVECAKMMKVAGIKKVWYREAYRNTEGIEFLKAQNIKIEQVKETA